MNLNYQNEKIKAILEENDRDQDREQVGNQDRVQVGDQDRVQDRVQVRDQVKEKALRNAYRAFPRACGYSVPIGFVPVMICSTILIMTCVERKIGAPIG